MLDAMKEHAARINVQRIAGEFDIAEAKANYWHNRITQEQWQIPAA